ncbi:MAG: hypothetical protein LBU22_03690 [Dysgonamonadaceae bacterium]|nr:hypothetical protein [Dysgonamonadaceae bacterium]
MKQICLIIGLLIGIHAQAQYSSEWDINMGGGISTLNYQASTGSASSGAGGSFGVGYTAFFSYQWGVTTGLAMGFYNTSYTLENIRLEYPAAVPAGLQGNFYLHANYEAYEEKQQTLLFQFPVMLQYQAPLGSSFFYLGAGIKIGVPVSATYNQSVKSITTSGYSDYTAQEYENMPNHGFDTYGNVKSSDILALNISGLLALESGIKWKISRKNALYTGIYLDYGLNNVQKESLRDFLEYKPTNSSDYQYNSMLQSQMDGNAFTNKVIPFALGIKIKLAFGSGGKKQRHPDIQGAKPEPLLGYMEW